MVWTVKILSKIEEMGTLQLELEYSNGTKTEKEDVRFNKDKTLKDIAQNLSEGINKRNTAEALNATVVEETWMNKDYTKEQLDTFIANN